MVNTIPTQAESSQLRTRCPWCLKLSDVPESICSACSRRIKVAGIARSAGVVVIPAPAPANQPYPLTLRVLSCMQDDGAIAGWIRADVFMMSRKTHSTQGAVYAALNRLVAMGWLEKRKTNQHTPNSPADYRVPMDIL